MLHVALQRNKLRGARLCALHAVRRHRHQLALHRPQPPVRLPLVFQLAQSPCNDDFVPTTSLCARGGVCAQAGAALLAASLSQASNATRRDCLHHRRA